MCDYGVLSMVSLSSIRHDGPAPTTFTQTLTLCAPAGTDAIAWVVALTHPSRKLTLMNGKIVHQAPDSPIAVTPGGGLVIRP